MTSMFTPSYAGEVLNTSIRSEDRDIDVKYLINSADSAAGAHMRRDSDMAEASVEQKELCPSPSPVNESTISDITQESSNPQEGDGDESKGFKVNPRLLKHTASFVASMEGLKHKEVRPEDDIWWEQRDGKALGDAQTRRYSNVESKLFAPTKALIHGSRPKCESTDKIVHKKREYKGVIPNELSTKPVRSASDRLVRPTAATLHAKVEKVDLNKNSTASPSPTAAVRGERDDGRTVLTRPSSAYQMQSKYSSPYSQTMTRTYSETLALASASQAERRASLCTSLPDCERERETPEVSTPNPGGKASSASARPVSEGKKAKKQMHADMAYESPYGQKMVNAGAYSQQIKAPPGKEDGASEEAKEAASEAIDGLVQAATGGTSVPKKRVSAPSASLLAPTTAYLAQVHVPVLPSSTAEATDASAPAPTPAPAHAAPTASVSAPSEHLLKPTAASLHHFDKDARDRDSMGSADGTRLMMRTISGRTVLSTAPAGGHDNGTGEASSPSRGPAGAANTHLHACADIKKVSAPSESILKHTASSQQLLEREKEKGGKNGLLRGRDSIGSSESSGSDKVLVRPPSEHLLKPTVASQHLLEKKDRESLGSADGCGSGLGLGLCNAALTRTFSGKTGLDTTVKRKTLHCPGEVNINELNACTPSPLSSPTATKEGGRQKAGEKSNGNIPFSDKHTKRRVSLEGKTVPVNTPEKRGHEGSPVSPETTWKLSHDTNDHTNNHEDVNDLKDDKDAYNLTVAAGVTNPEIA